MRKQPELRLPWWTPPWRRIAVLRGICRAQERTNRDLQQRLLKAQQIADDYRRTVSDPAGVFARADSAVPEFVITGLDRIGQGKRIMASRHLSGTKLTMTGESEPGPARWQVGATMDRMLVIDKPSYREALDYMTAIWDNWDREERSRQTVLLLSQSPEEMLRRKLGS